VALARPPDAAPPPRHVSPSVRAVAAPEACVIALAEINRWAPLGHGAPLPAGVHTEQQVSPIPNNPPRPHTDRLPLSVCVKVWRDPRRACGLFHSVHRAGEEGGTTWALEYQAPHGPARVVVAANGSITGLTWTGVPLRPQQWRRDPKIVS
jgi:hypothetical protein